MNINPTIAKKLNEQHSVGATLIIGLQVFKAFGLTEFTTFTTTQDNTAKLTNQGAEVTYGAGVRLGWLGSYMNNKLKLGAEYTSRTYMKPFDDYTDLFAEQGDIDTPGNIGVGLAYDVNDALKLGFDINYIMYEDIASISNPGPDPAQATPFPVDRATNALGRDAGLGFGWENQTVFKLGAIYTINPKLIARAGWNYGKSPIDENKDILFNIVAPATTQHHLTLGGTYMLDADIELSFSYIHAFEYTQGGPTFIGFEGQISMEQDAIGGTFSLKF
jgi:long-chain fatty acid transport protein